MAKRALLIGVNKYRIPGSDLRGCVNDVKNLSAALVELCGFKSRDITVLTDAKATKKAIQAGITKLVSGGQKGDSLVLHYSGHGSNVPDDNEDEPDHRDEILCPTDLDWDDPLRDDWLRHTFNGLRKGVSLAVIMDCCHSGTNTRAPLPPDAPVKPRYLPSPFSLQAAESGRAVPMSLRGAIRRASPQAKRTSDIVAVDIAEILITGCRDTQTSADAFLDGEYAGALTYSLVRAIRDAKGKLTYAELHERASQVLKKKRFAQVPQLEGRKANLSKQVFA